MAGLFFVIPLHGVYAELPAIAIIIDDIEITGNLVGDQYFAYRSVGGHNFRMYALHSKELYDVLITMAASITTIED